MFSGGLFQPEESAIACLVSVIPLNDSFVLRGLPCNAFLSSGLTSQDVWDTLATSQESLQLHIKTYLSRNLVVTRVVTKGPA